MHRDASPLRTMLGSLAMMFSAGLLLIVAVGATSGLAATGTSLTRSGSAGGPNMIVDPSVETAATSGRPVGWKPVQWGSHATTFSYLKRGHRGRRSLEVHTTAWTSGAAEWYCDDIPVKPGASYHYSDWYRADVPTVVDAEVVNRDGTLSYYYLGAALASHTWSRFAATFTPPVGTRSISIYQAIGQVGYLVTDDYSLRAYKPAPFRRPIVSIDFDDGWASQYTNAVPLLQANGLTASFYIITGQSITTPNPICMDVADLRSLIADGYEIGNHTATHPDLTTLSPTQVRGEMSDAQAAFQEALGITPTDFAYPYGAYDAQTIAVAQRVGFASQRGVNVGFNTKDDIDFTQLKVEEVNTSTTPAQVEGWVHQAIADRSWLILLYHQVGAKPAVGVADGASVTTPADLAAELDYIRSSRVPVETTAQAVAEIEAQLG